MSISPQWTCAGEAGRSLDATARSFAELKAFGLTFDFPDLATGVAQFSIRIGTLVPVAGDRIPDDGQKLTIYRSGTRFFQGTCRVEQDDRVFIIKVNGIEWDLEQEPLTDDQTDVLGTTAERPIYAFPSQSLTTSVNTILTRAIAKGVPVAVGSLATTFTAPEISIKLMNCGQALADLIRMTPDVMAWVDYSPATPTYNTARRKTATVRTIAAGDCNHIRIKRDVTYRVDHLKVAYHERATDGRRILAEQVSGDAGTAQTSTSSTLKLRAGASSNNGSYVGATVTILTGTGAGQSRTITAYNGTTKVASITPNWSPTPTSTSTYQVGGGLGTTGKRQIHVVSGEEVDTTLPNDYFDSVQLKTVTAASDQTATVKALDDTIKGIINQYGTIGGGVATGLTYYSGFSNGPKTAVGRSYPGTVFKKDGVVVSTTGKHVVVAGEVPDWLMVTLGAVKVDMSCTYVATLVGQNGQTTFPDWFLALANGNIDTVGQSGGFASNLTTGTAATLWIWWCAVPISVSCWLINTPYSTLTTVYRPADYSFVFPPSGFAAGMQESNGFDVYTGTISFKSALPGGTRYRGCVVNLSGHRTEYASMLATVRNEHIDVESGETTITLGAPPRFSYRSWFDRARTRASNNIKYVTP